MADTSNIELVPHDTLSAVNVLLRAVNRAEVSSLAYSDMDANAQSAKEHIANATIEVQLTYDWECNYDTGVTLLPNEDSEIVLPTNTVQVRLDDRSAHTYRVSVRGQKLYNKDTFGFQFDGPLCASIKYMLPFEELPATLRWFVVATAGVRYGAQWQPDSQTYKFSSSVADVALAAAQRMESWSNSNDISLDSPYFRKALRR